MNVSTNSSILSMLDILALNKNTNAISKSLERLSTGCRINHAKDDAAGSAISLSLSNKISSYNIVDSNAQTAQAMINTANDALVNIQDILIRVRDLTQQSLNGTYSLEERQVMQNEANKLIDEMYRIKSTTKFNNKQVLGEVKILTKEEEAIAQGYTIVKSAQDLKKALKANDVNCKVMLFADIDLDDLGVDGSGSNWSAIGTNQETDKFQGTIDGNGFTISNLKINKTEESAQGLFGYTSGATIKNIVLENAKVAGNHHVGALIGRSYASTIENCTVPNA